MVTEMMKEVPKSGAALSSLKLY